MPAKAASSKLGKIETQVGVRELRRNLSSYLKRAQDGESITITDHNRRIARLAPLAPAEAWLEEMIAHGLATRAKGDLLDLEPLPRKPGERPLSQILQEMRDEERY